MRFSLLQSKLNRILFGFAITSFLFINNNPIHAQLSEGDIAIIAFNADVGDDLAFVALVDIPASENIYFTDNEWGGSAFNDLNEGELTWTNSGSILSAGSVVVFTDVSKTSSTGRFASVGTLTGSNFNLGASNEWIYALTSIPATSYVSPPTFLAAFASDAGTGWLTNTNLTEGTTAIDFNDDKDGYKYIGDNSGETSFSSYLALINNPTNLADSWQIESSNGENILEISTTSFTIESESNPNPTVGFDSETSSENENNSSVNTTIPISFSNYSGSEVTIDITVDSTSSAESEDYSLNTSSLTFNENATQNIDLTLYDDADYDSETIILNIAVSSGTAELGISQHTLTLSDNDVPILTISEIMYNSSGTDDEWIEILNDTGSSIDISGWNLQSVSGSGTTLFSYNFPSSTTITNGQFFTIAVGSNGDGTFNNENPFTPDSNTLGVDNSAVSTTNDSNNLNNSSGTITISTSSGSTVDEVTYDDGHDSETDGSGPSYEIIDVNVDNSSTASNWLSSGSSGGSPGYNGTITWTGGVDSDWSNASNWSPSQPSNTTNVYIPNGLTTYPSISSQAASHNMIISSSASITITENGSLQTAGDLTNNGIVTMNSTATSYSSLIVGGSVTGSVTYNRYADVDRWYIISSPVSGQDIDTFISNEELAVSANNSSLVGLADYNNDGSQYAADPTITTGWWDYHQSGQSGSGNFTDGKGKIVRLASDATDNLLGFTGSVSGFVTVPLSVATTAFNLVGNPYPAAIQVTSQGGATNDLLSNNTSAFSEETAWFWNGATNGYDAVNQNPSQSAKIAAPGQGFFVSAASSGSLSFTSSMQTAPTTPSSYELAWSQSNSSSQQLTVNVGDTVTWIWGSGSHNLAQTNGDTEPGFGEGFYSDGHTYEHTFTTVGSHDYICSPHSLSMNGTITVVQPNNTFNRLTEWSKIDLSMSADGQTSDTEIVYFDGATTGWDNGYDSTNMGSESFQIFTSHVDTSTSQNLAIQSLPLGNFNDMVVPVGVNASAGQMITISVDTTNWPEGANIYLEDVDNGSYTLLDGQNAEFTTLLDSNESGIGRFYIHTTSNSLGDEDLTLTDVSIYASSRDNLRILGINSGQANVQMFDLMGKQVLNTSFNGQSVNDVKLPNLNTGIYLVNLASDEGTINKKIIIQ